MSKLLSPHKELSTSQASHYQQAQVELLNPSIERKRKAAIAMSPPTRKDDNMICPTIVITWVQFKAGSNKEERMQHFCEIVGKANTQANYGGTDKRARGKNRKNSPEIIESI
ncbi:MAG: hypothetical protein WCR72_01860 [Bacteroidota bacterium]